MAKSDELNPLHPVTYNAHDQWHKFCAILMVKFGVDQVLITKDDIQAVSDRKGGCNIVVKDGANKPGEPAAMELRLVTDIEARRLAVEAGGIFR